MSQIQELSRMIDQAEKITFLTGAGVSTESGIPDFRGTNGVWNKGENLEQYVTRSFFYSKPKIFWQKYKQFFKLDEMDKFEPNAVHRWISQLQNEKESITVITQNIDGLHTKAGSQTVYEVHGTLKTATCPKCGAVYPIDYLNSQGVPRCSPDVSLHRNCGLILKPDTVLFGDLVRDFDVSKEEALTSDLFIVMGTSLKVGPINTLPKLVKNKNIPMVLLNQEPTELDHLFNLVINERLGQVIQRLQG